MQYFLEWLITVFLTIVLYKGFFYLYRKRFQRLFSAIFSFLTLGVIAFLITPYVIETIDPTYIYLPVLIVFFGIDIYQSLK